MVTISNDALCGHTMIPDLIRAIPAARAVLDRYGLRGCGGTLGPAETLEFFARAHDVPLGKLLEEIRQASAAEDTTSQVAAPSEWESLADTIYRPFFRAGIGVALTLGAAWGAILLLRIAWSDSFSALSIHEVNAHGHAQIFGWVGLFVMGFAYQAFPRFKHTSLAHPRLAYASFWMMLLGLVARSITQATMRWWPWLGLMGVGASGVEIAAIATMLFVVAATYRQSDRPLETYDWYIFAGLGWFLIQAIAGTAYFASTWAAPDRESLLSLVATWQPALREIQVHGFAVLMILGVSQRVFHFFYGLPRPSRTKSRAVLPVINISIMGMVAGLILMRLAGHGWAGLWYSSILILTASVVYLVLDWRIFSLPQERDRSLKFLRTAYVWLFVSLAMLVLLPVHELVILPRLAPGSDAVRIGFSHAYYGAIRHAITVGFISFQLRHCRGRSRVLSSSRNRRRYCAQHLANGRASQAALKWDFSELMVCAELQGSTP